jgi:hypothetical protein
MKKSEIITLIVAVYGAGLATVSALRQWWIDRAKVKLVVNRNMQIYRDPRYEGKTLTVITITNTGHRPVTIRSFGASGLHPHKSLAGMESVPQLPVEIGEGQFITSNWEQDGLDFSKIDHWYANDSHGRVYKLREASRFEHWKSVRRWKRDWRKNSKLREQKE